MSVKFQKNIIYVTKNEYKVLIAKKMLEGSRFNIVQKVLEIPEIQSDKVEEISAFSAEWACQKIRQPVIVSDIGCYIEALNGFPGPFIKYVNQWLTADDLIKLMAGHINRKATFKDAIAYCSPGGKPIVFVSVFWGNIAERAGKKIGGVYEKLGPIDELWIPKGYDRPGSEILTQEWLNFWADHKKYTGFNNLKKYLDKNL